MVAFPFAGPSYVYSPTNFDAQRAINLYLVKSETGNSKAPTALHSTPGRSLLATLPVQPIRGSYTTQNRAFFVAYNKVYELLSDNTTIERGTILTYSGTVSISDNGTQVIIVDGTPTGGWILDLNTNVFTQITSPGFLGATTVTFLDGYFVCNEPDTGVYFISNLYDGLTWDPLDFANAEGSPDQLVAVITLHRQTWLIGADTIEVVYDAGSSPFPLATIQGVLIEYGCVAPFSVQKTANTILWIGNDESGHNVVWMANGYQPTRVSTEAIEQYLQRFEANINTCVAYSYQEQGHYFYIINIQGAETSLCYDITTKSWHERARWNSSTGSFERDRANNHIFCFGKHLVGDFETGRIFNQSLDYTSDAGELIRRLRSMPYISDDLEYLYFSKFQLDMQTGVGIDDPTDYTGVSRYLITQGADSLLTQESEYLITEGTEADFITPESVDPMIILQWSDDNGNTWSPEKQASVGRIGEFARRVIWRRLGRSRARIFRVIIIADVKVFLIGAHIDLERGYA